MVEQPEAPSAHRFTIDDVERMFEVGILPDDERVELIDGQIITMPRPGPRHTGYVNRLTMLFTDLVRGRAVVSVQNPVFLDKYNFPMPDLTVLQPSVDDDLDTYPQDEDVLLVVEVSDTTLSYDRRVKGALYARLGLPEYWVIDVKHQYVDVFRRPSPEGYGRTERMNIDDTLTLSMLEGIEIPVRRVFEKLQS